jgi:hypothetical protein
MRMVSIGQDRSMDTAGDDVVIRLNHDEALVLFELLHRWEQLGRPGKPEHHAEQVVLWDLSAVLETALRESFQPDYHRLVADARTRLAGEEPSAGSP